MGSPIIGRTACPECGNPSAHVKKSEKVTFRFCPRTGLDDEPGCGAQYHATTPRQVRDLLAKTRPIDAPAGTPAPAPVALPPAGPHAEAGLGTPTPAPSPTPAAPAPGRSRLFSL